MPPKIEIPRSAPNPSQNSPAQPDAPQIEIPCSAPNPSKNRNPSADEEVEAEVAGGGLRRKRRGQASGRPPGQWISLLSTSPPRAPLDDKPLSTTIPSP
jgi:hypothetical protein